MDFVVDGKVVLEIKSVSKVQPIHKAQLHTYVRLSRCRVGLLMNFNTVRLIDGVTRVVY